MPSDIFVLHQHKREKVSFFAPSTPTNISRRPRSNDRHVGPLKRTSPSRGTSQVQKRTVHVLEDGLACLCSWAIKDARERLAAGCRWNAGMLVERSSGKGASWDVLQRLEARLACFCKVKVLLKIASHPTRSTAKIQPARGRRAQTRRFPLVVVLDGRHSTQLIGSRRLPNVKQRETAKGNRRIRGLSLAACQENRRPCPASWPGWLSRFLVFSTAGGRLPFTACFLVCQCMPPWQNLSVVFRDLRGRDIIVCVKKGVSFHEDPGGLIATQSTGSHSHD